MKYLLILLFPLVALAFPGFEEGTSYSSSFSNGVITTDPVRLENFNTIAYQFTYTGSSIDASCSIEGTIDGTNYIKVVQAGANAQVTLTAAGGSDIIAVQAEPKYTRARCISNDADTVSMVIKYWGKGL